MAHRNTVKLFLVFGLVSFFLLALAASISLSVSKDSEVFHGPRVSPSAALRRAKDFIASQEAAFDARAIRFQKIEYAAFNQEIVYLLKQYGPKEAMNLMKTQGLPYAYWLISLTDKGRHTATVGVDSVSGNIVRYAFSPEAKAQTKSDVLTLGEAENVSRSFLQRQGVGLSDFVLEDIQKNTAQSYDEYEVTWARKHDKVKGERFLGRMTVRGKKVVDFSFGLQLPKVFTRNFAFHALLSESVLGLSVGFWILSGIVLLGFFVIRRKSLNYTRAKASLGLLGLMFFAHFFNEQASYAWHSEVLLKTLGALFFASLVFVLIPVTEDLFKESFLRDIGIQRTRSALSASVVIGYSLAFCMLVFVSVVYGYWEQMHLVWNTGADEIVGVILTSKVVAAAPILMGIIPAFTEEYFRAFWIALLKKTGSPVFLSVVVSALLWGFAHTSLDASSYPGYITGIEKFFSGIIIGYCLIYFGIETVMIWHFLNNFLATHLLLFTLGTGYRAYASWSLAVMLLPFIAALFVYFKKPESGYYLD